MPDELFGMKNVMKDEPIVKEVRRVRRKILAAHGGSFEAMSHDVMKRQWHSGHVVIRPLEKRCNPARRPIK